MSTLESMDGEDYTSYDGGAEGEQDGEVDSDDVPEEPYGEQAEEEYLAEDPEEEYLEEDYLDEQDEYEEPPGQIPISPSPPRSGKNGPRSSNSSDSGRPSSRKTPSGGNGPSASPNRSDKGSNGKDKKDGKESTDSNRKRPRGNLPPAPTFSGDVKADPKCFKKYVGKVDSYVELARMIIDDKEIGLRLFSALDGSAADFLEDVPAKTFAGADGWRILMRVLRDKFDQPRQQKVGSAMKSFFKLQIGNNCTMREACDLLDKAHRQCRDTGLTLPDAVMIYYFFEHAHISQEKQANLLLRTNGEYNWKSLKQAVDLLYPNVYVGRGSYGYPRGQGGKGRTAHEVHGESQDGVPAWDATEDQLEGWLYENDPIETLAEVELYQGLPEEVSRELHQVFSTHRENRQKLAKAVKARGFYVSGQSGGKGGKKGKYGGKSGGKSSKGGKKGGKARGMSLADLKAVTTCGDCDQVGHWKGDPECPKQRRGANEAAREEEAEEAWDEYDEGADYEWGDEYWEEQYDGQARSAHTAYRTTSTSRTTPLKSSSSRPMTASPPSSRPPPSPTLKRPFSAFPPQVEAEAKKITHHINAMRKKTVADKAKPVPLASVREELNKELESDEFLAGVENIKQLIDARTQNLITESGPSAIVAEAVRHYESEPFDAPGSAFALLRDKTKGPEIESLRRSKTAFMTRRVHWEDDDIEEQEMIPDTVMLRQVRALTRRPATVVEGHDYLTIDTACENTVCGKNTIAKIATRFFDEFKILPKVNVENEKYCFGPGDPITSSTRISLPIGIQGHPMVINTSVIDIKDGKNEVPFLAGQDWLHYVKAVIDVGQDTLMLKLDGGDILAPLHVDHTAQ